MPVMGPVVPVELVDKIYNEVLQLLKEKHFIQNYEPIFNKEKRLQDRKERNQALKDAIYKIVELETWESF